MSKNDKSKIINKKDNSKLVDTFIIIGIIFLIGSLILMFSNNSSENHIKEIKYNEYKEKLAEDKYNIILLTSPTCSHCVSYKPYVNAIADDYNLEIYNINLNNLSYEEYIEIHDSFTATKDKYDDGVPGIPTPVTIITKNGVEVTSILGDIGSSGFLNLLKRYEIVK